MKLIRIATMRGSIQDGIVERKILFDGRFDTGWRIVSFVIFPEDPTQGNSDCYGSLATTSSGATSEWNADGNTQIAWSATNSLGYGLNNSFELVDKENLVVEDLYIYANDAVNNDVNYRIEMEQYKFSDWRGALAMVRNNSQNVARD